MKKNYRKTLLSVAIAALISAPAWSAIDLSASSNDENKPRQSQSEHGKSQHGQTIARDSRSEHGAARAQASTNELYARTPEDLSGMDVIDSDGEPLGSIKTVVMGRDRDEVHAVITSGGIMGMGTRETLVALDDLTLLEDDEVQVDFTKATLPERTEFKAEEYGQMESNRRISDFSAFEPTKASDSRTAQTDRAATADSRTAQTDRAATADSRTTAQSERTDSSEEARSTWASEQSRSAGSEDESTRVSSQSDMNAHPLHRFTPKDLKGMEVIGSDRETIGKVKAIVSSTSDDKIHAVITSGGFLGIGSTEILVPLDELKSVDDKQLQAEFSRDAVEAKPKFESPEYTNLDNSRPISEFFASTQSDDREAQRAKDQQKGQLR